MSNKVYEEGKEFGFFNVVRKCLRDVVAVSDDKECLRKVIQNFRDFFTTEKENLSFSMTEETRKKVIDSLETKKYDILEYENGSETVDLTSKLKKMENCLMKMKDDFDMEAVKAYIVTYMSTLVEDAVYGINISEEANESKTFANLYNLGIFPYKENSYYASIYNPFLLSSVCNIAFAIVRNYKSVNSIPELREMNYEMFVSKAKKCFTRYTCDSRGIRCKYFLDDNGIVSSVPMKELSSLEYFNPMILFEKIASFISGKLESCGECEWLKIDITIIGGRASSYTSAIDTNKEDFMILLKAIISWYSNISSSKKLNISLTNILNSNDNSKEEVITEWAVEENKGELICKVVEFIKFDATPFKNLKNTIDKSDMVFFLDCPLVSVLGKYEFSKFFKGMYDLHGKKKMEEEFSDISTYELFQEVDWIAFSFLKNDGRSEGVKRLKYCRMMNSRYTVNSSLWEEIEKSRCDEIYFYFSKNITDTIFYAPKQWENFSMSMSECESFFYYSHSKIEPTRLLSKEETSIKFTMMSFVNNLPKEYIFGALKNEIESSLEFDSQESYLEFLSALFIRVDVVSSKEVIISLFSNNLKEILKQMHFKDVDKVIENITEEILGFIKCICKKSIFSDSKNFEDAIIKEAFENCIYENASDLNALLFHNIYKIRNKSGHLGGFKIKYNEKFKIDEDKCLKVKNTDKYFYSSILEAINGGTYLSMGTLHHLFRANEIFKTTISGMLHELEQADRQTGLLTVTQKENLLKLIKENRD